MSALAKKAREAAKEKAERMVRPTTGKVDASSYDAPETFGSGKPTGPLPTGRRAYREGGKVSGEAAAMRADKAPRKGNKRGAECAERAGKMIGGSLAYLSPALMAANALRDKDRENHANGGTAGDLVPTSRMAFAPTGGSRLSRSLGLKTGGKSVSDGSIQGTRPTGGRLARKDGGRAKKGGKVDINIVIGAPKSEGPPMGLKPPMAPPPMPPMPPPSMGPQGPGGPPPGLGALPPGLPPGMPPMARKAGGRTYRSAKDMDAGSLSGLGRLEKTEIQKHKG